MIVMSALMRTLLVTDARWVATACDDRDSTSECVASIPKFSNEDTDEVGIQVAFERQVPWAGVN
jgi:hypothetical protein